MGVKPEILNAKSKTAAAPMPTPMAVAAPTPTAPATQVSVFQKWRNKHNGGDVDAMSSSLRGVTDRGGFLNKSFNPNTELGDATQANLKLDIARAKAKAEGKSAPTGGFTSGQSKSGKLMVLKMAEDMFDAAEKAGYKTRDQFATAYESLKNASPITKKFSSDPNFVNMTQTNGASLKDSLADKYQELVNERTPTLATTSAQQPARIRVSTQKKSD
jgi:dihydroorotase-like cyclic amidohydrolase